jgi:iron complex outermembrane recepter protein
MRLSVSLLVSSIPFLSLSYLASGAELEEVLVTAQKRPQNLQQASVAVSVISAQDLRQRGIRDLAELQQLAPSLIVQQGSSANAASFGIRGVYTNSENAGLESSVGLYVDGVYRARQGAMVNNLFDVEQVEVLRGPQGTLFGRNTPAGAVLVTSIKPDHRGGGYIEAETGSSRLASVSGAYSISASDELALRFSGFGMQRDGYVGDVNFGDDVFNERNRWGARLQALYTPGPNLDITLIADWSELEENCCAAGSWKGNTQASDLPPGSTPKSGTDTLVSTLGGRVIPGEDFYDYRTALTTESLSENRDSGLSARIDWQIQDYQVTSITAVRQFSFDDFGDADFADIAALTGGIKLEQKQFSQELNVGRQLQHSRWDAGAYWYRHETDSEGRLIIGDDLATMAGLPAVALPAEAEARSDARQSGDSLALFGQTEIDIQEHLTLTAGLRWTRESKTLRNHFSEDASQAPDFVSPGWGFWLLTPLAPRPDVRESLDDEQLTGTLKLSWQATDHTLFYMSWGTGYKAGGINTSRIDPTLDPVFDAESSESYELGLKTAFPSQALRVNLALHQTQTDDLQTQSFQGTGFTLQNAGVADTTGAELDLAWAPLTGVQVSLAYAYNRAEYEEFSNGSCWVGTPWHTDRPDPGDNGDGSCDRSGDRLPGNAEHRGVLGLGWEYQLTQQLSSRLYGEYVYSGDRMTAQNNDPETLDGSYTLLNLRLGLHYQPWNMALTAWGRNLGDENYRTITADAPLQAGRFIAFHNEPRSWGVSVRKEF